MGAHAVDTEKLTQLTNSIHELETLSAAGELTCRVASELAMLRRNIALLSAPKSTWHEPGPNYAPLDRTQKAHFREHLLKCIASGMVLQEGAVSEREVKQYIVQAIESFEGPGNEQQYRSITREMLKSVETAFGRSYHHRRYQCLAALAVRLFAEPAIQESSLWLRELSFGGADLGIATEKFGQWLEGQKSKGEDSNFRPTVSHIGLLIDRLTNAEMGGQLDEIESTLSLLREGLATAEHDDIEYLFAELAKVNDRLSPLVEGPATPEWYDSQSHEAVSRETKEPHVRRIDREDAKIAFVVWLATGGDIGVLEETPDSVNTVFPLEDALNRFKGDRLFEGINEFVRIYGRMRLFDPEQRDELRSECNRLVINLRDDFNKEFNARHHESGQSDSVDTRILIRPRLFSPYLVLAARAICIPKLEAAEVIAVMEHAGCTDQDALIRYVQRALRRFSHNIGPECENDCRRIAAETIEARAPYPECRSKFFSCIERRFPDVLDGNVLMLGTSYDAFAHRYPGHPSLFGSSSTKDFSTIDPSRPYRLILADCGDHPLTFGLVQFLRSLSRPRGDRSITAVICGNKMPAADVLAYRKHFGGIIAGVRQTQQFYCELNLDQISGVLLSRLNGRRLPDRSTEKAFNRVLDSFCMERPHGSNPPDRPGSVELYAGLLKDLRLLNEFASERQLILYDEYQSHNATIEEAHRISRELANFDRSMIVEKQFDASQEAIGKILEDASSRQTRPLIPEQLWTGVRKQQYTPYELSVMHRRAHSSIIRAIQNALGDNQEIMTFVLSSTASFSSLSPSANGASQFWKPWPLAMQLTYLNDLGVATLQTCPLTSRLLLSDDDKGGTYYSVTYQDEDRHNQEGAGLERALSFMRKATSFVLSHGGPYTFSRDGRPIMPFSFDRQSRTLAFHTNFRQDRYTEREQLSLDDLLTALSAIDDFRFTVGKVLEENTEETLNWSAMINRMSQASALQARVAHP